MTDLGTSGTVVVLGGSSDIGLAIAHRLVARGARRLVLAGRDPAAMQAAAAPFDDGVEVQTLAFDADETEDHGAFFDEVFAAGDVDVVVAAFGLLGHGQGIDVDPGSAVALAQTNYVGTVSVGLHVARHLRRQQHGALVVLSSVAGERVRKPNFVYGSTKAALDAFAQGLGDAVHDSGARVLVVRPGFVRTKMTEGLPGAPFATTADAVAERVVRGLERGSELIWAPPILRVVMSAARHMPRALFRRLPY